MTVLSAALCAVSFRRCSICPTHRWVSCGIESQAASNRFAAGNGENAQRFGRVMGFRPIFFADCGSVVCSSCATYDSTDCSTGSHAVPAVAPNGSRSCRSSGSQTCSWSCRPSGSRLAPLWSCPHLQGFPMPVPGPFAGLVPGPISGLVAHLVPAPLTVWFPSHWPSGYHPVGRLVPISSAVCFPFPSAIWVLAGSHAVSVGPGPIDRLVPSSVPGPRLPLPVQGWRGHCPSGCGWIPAALPLRCGRGITLCHCRGLGCMPECRLPP